MFSAFFTGFFLGLSLIVAIGAQNAFVLRQGILRQHVFSIALFCSISDALLIILGVAGISYFLNDFINEYSKNDKDTGSAGVQIAVLTERIKNLTEHFKTHNKDNHSKRGLVSLVNKRKKLLNYLSKKNKSEYSDLIKKLNIRG